MIFCLLNRWESSFKRKRPNHNSGMYIIEKVGRKVEIRRADSRQLYQVLWDVDPSIDTVAPACHLHRDQFVS